jgi:hypothetical protein
LFKNYKFNNYRDIYSDNEYINHIRDINFANMYTAFKEGIIYSEEEHVKVDIIKPLLIQHLDSLTKDINDLKDKISLLEIDLQQKRIISIDSKNATNKLVDSILDNLHEMEDKLSKSPVLR